MSEEEFCLKMNKIIEDYKKHTMRRWLHEECDDLLKDFLLKNGFYKVYTEYNEISTEFWYA